jgi:hypothetical protein
MADSRGEQSAYGSRLLESDFPLAAVNRLVQSELRAHRPVHPVSRWWHPRPVALWRSLLLAGLISRQAWETLSPRGDAPNSAAEPTAPADNPPPDSWQRLYYRLDPPAEKAIRDEIHGREVLDLCAGGGTILHEGMRLGADVVGVDSSPLAWLTLKKSTEGVTVDALEAALGQVEARMRLDSESSYRTTCPQCQQPALAQHTFWVRTVTCPTADCGADIPLFGGYALSRKAGREGQVLLVCPSCGAVYDDAATVLERGTTCPACGVFHSAQHITVGCVDGAEAVCPHCHIHHDWQALLVQQPVRYEMAALEVSCRACGGVHYKAPDGDDRARYEAICQRLTDEEERLRLPDQPIPSAEESDVGQRLHDFGFHRWVDVFNPRQRLLLAHLRDAIMALDNLDAAEHLLLAWAETIEYYNMAATYLPGSRWTHTIYSPQPFVPWTLSVESWLWGAPDQPDTFHGQVALAAAELAQAHKPVDVVLSAGGRRRLHPTGDAAVPPRSRRLLLRFPPHALADAQLKSGSIDLAIFDPPRLDPVTIAHLSDFLYVWLRSALARDYPVVFAGAETRKLPFAGEGDAAVEALRQLRPGLRDGGLVVWVQRRHPDDPWGESLLPLLQTGYAIRAMHPIRLSGVSDGGIQDRSRTPVLLLVVAGKGEEAVGGATYAQVEEEVTVAVEDALDVWWPQVETGTISPTEAAFEALGMGLRGLCDFVRGGEPQVTWRGQPITLAEMMDGNSVSGLPGLTRLVDLAVFRREMALWPDELDETSRFYLTTLLGQSVLPEARLAWRLETLPSLSLQEVQQQRLVHCRDGRARVRSPRQRLSYLRHRWLQEQAWIAQPTLPGIGSGAHYLTAVDRLHLLLGVLEEGGEVDSWIAGWRDLDSLAALCQQISDRLPRGAQRRRYAHLHARLTFVM